MGSRRARPNRDHQMVRHRFRSRRPCCRRSWPLDPAAATTRRARLEADIDRFLVRVRSAASPPTGRPYTPGGQASHRRGLRLRAARRRDMGLLSGLGADLRHPPGRRRAPGRDDEPRAGPCPPHVVAQLDGNLELLARRSPARRAARRIDNLGVLGERAGEMAVLVLPALEGHRPARRRGGQLAPRVPGRRRARQGRCSSMTTTRRCAWDAGSPRRLGARRGHPSPAVLGEERFPDTPPSRAVAAAASRTGTSDGTAHIAAGQIGTWIKAWVGRIPRIDAGPSTPPASPSPFDRRRHPSARLPPHLCPDPRRPGSRRPRCCGT